MSDAPRPFEAPDLIEVMEEAVRYNRFLVGRLLAWCPSAGRVLDFGAGNGRFARALRARGHDVHAVEPDPALRARLDADGIPTFGGVPPRDAAPFDAVYSINVLEHIPDDHGLLRDLGDRLAPGGRLLLYTPAFEVLFSANDVRVGHVRRYRRSTLSAAVRGAGLCVESVEYVDSLGFLAALLYRVAGDRDGGLSLRAVKVYDRIVFPLSRALDRVLGRVVGKNLLLTATRPPADAAPTAR
jgi:SAM-dependent methyltransferase